MKHTIFILVLAATLSSPAYLYAHEGMDHDENMESMEEENNEMMEQGGPMMNGAMTAENGMHVATAEEATTLPDVGNKSCPVSGDKIPAPGEKAEMGEVIKFVYNGKIYNLCCPMCVKDFKKDPEKYSKIAEDEVAKEKAAQTEQK